MAVYEALLLNTAVPQIQAAQAGDSYVMVVNATTPALRITQTGTGDSILVEDAANPDSSPFVVTSAGDVGIGTNAPAYKLDVSGSVIRLNNSGSTADIFLTDSGTTNGHVRLRGESNAMKFITGNGISATLDSSGNLGLGVTPSAWGNGQSMQGSGWSLSTLLGTDQSGFYTNARQTAYGNFNTNWVYRTSASAVGYAQASGSHVWLTAASGTAGDAISFTQAMTLDASGNLGVGETSPSTFGKVVSRGGTFSLVADTASQRRLSFWATANGNSENAYIQVQNDGLTTNTGEMLFATRNTSGTLAERARITPGGNLLVGTQTDSGAKCTIDAASATNAVNIALPSYDYFGISIHNKATSNDNCFIAFGTEASFTTRGSITYNRAGGLTAYNTTSDYRAKDVTGPVANSGATIDALKVYNGKMKGATVERPMLIAHEAQAVTPYAVTGEKDAVNDDGTPKYQQMDVSSLVPLLIAEIQSLRARVAQLEAK
jgi:hypothetical protein